ncbi:MULTISPECIES: hypothetical protein [unclassified Streptomyces]|uniref:hypothetical protein n=1 Tax=unclassified Streptomyces TaxID=2593676 RepID=UPI001F21BAEA|nr:MULTISPECIES: hypothetical protein [unclassified Streptomyces]
MLRRLTATAALSALALLAPVGAHAAEPGAVGHTDGDGNWADFHFRWTGEFSFDSGVLKVHDGDTDGRSVYVQLRGRKGNSGWQPLVSDKLYWNTNGSGTTRTYDGIRFSGSLPLLEVGFALCEDRTGVDVCSHPGVVAENPYAR